MGSFGQKLKKSSGQLWRIYAFGDERIKEFIQLWQPNITQDYANRFEDFFEIKTDIHQI